MVCLSTDKSRFSVEAIERACSTAKCKCMQSVELDVSSLVFVVRCPSVRPEELLQSLNPA